MLFEILWWLLDFKAITKTYSSKFKTLIGKKTEYGKRFAEDDPFGFGYEAQYEFMFFNKPFALLDFKNFLERNNVKNILEIGCSVGLFPRTFPSLFKDIEYTGIDISKRSIETCKKYLDHEFIHGDYLKIDLDRKFDLIFSFHVIDHVQDVNHFLTKTVDTCKKFAYISSYRGYFPQLKTHQIEYRADEGIYYNNIAIPEVKKIFSEIGLAKNNYIIRSQVERDKILYDSELARIWKYANDKVKNEILELTGLTASFFETIPLELDLNTNIVDQYPNLDKILARKIGFDINEIQSQKTTVIEIQKWFK